MPGRRNPACWLLAMLAMLVSCTAEDPDAALRELVERAEEAIEGRDAGFFRDVLAERYSDARGNDPDALVAMLRGYFLTHDSIEAVTRIDSVTLNGTDAAEVVVFAGVLGRRAASPLITGLDGRLHRIEVELTHEDGEWQVIGAHWERSSE